MCGIIGYNGKSNSIPVLLNGLKRLEYRGYDSYGFATANGAIKIRKNVGKIGGLSEKDLSELKGTIGFGHTRWATHGGVTIDNAHPHADCTGRFALIHNGIVENFDELKKELLSKGHKFKSQTDTEVIVHLIEESAEGDAKEAIIKAVSRMHGSFTFLLLDSNEKKLYGYRKDSPLVLGVGDGEMFLASDVPAFLKYTNKVVFMENNQLAVLSENDFEILENGEKIAPKIQEIAWSFEEAEKGGYEHFMIKEINDQRETIKLALEQNENVITVLAKEINKAKGVFFVACGTSYHAALCASYVFSKIAKKHINVVIASEFPNYEHFLQKETLIVTISQSGETADVLEAVNVSRSRESKVVSIINVMGSSLMRSSDYSLLLNAGPEICVLATKTYTSQVALLTLLAYATVGKLNEGKNELYRISHRVADVLDNSEYIEELAKLLKDKEHLFLIGRSVSYATALEAALKLKEVSYIHAEALAGGELKHGTLALIEPGIPCIAFVPGDDTDMNILSNAQEIKARGGYIIGVGPKKYDVFDFFVPVPNGGDDNLGRNVFHPILSIIPMQLLAYHMALLRGCDPDKPRNLAKSVTVK